jgi:hypothetical protein
MLIAAPYICGQPAVNTDVEAVVDVSKPPMPHGFHAKVS